MTRPYLKDLIARMTLVEEGVDSEDSVSWHAYREAEKLDDLSMVDDLEAFLKQGPKHGERSAAYFIIGKIGLHGNGSQCAERLIAHIALDENKYALSSLLDSLVDLPKAEEVDLSPVFLLLDDKRWLVRHAAIRALWHAASPQAEERVLEHLAGTSDAYDITYCHSTLNRIGTRKAVPALRLGLKSRKRDVKLSAELAIAAIEARESS